MKLRQKLAMVLAAAMVVTAVPVTTMAASTNSMTQNVSMVAGTMLGVNEGKTLEIEGNEYTTYKKDANDTQLKVEFEDELNGSTTFYLEAQDFVFTPQAFATYDQGKDAVTTSAAIKVKDTAYDKSGKVVGASIQAEGEEVKVLTRDALEKAGLKVQDSDLKIAGDNYTMEWLNGSQIRVTVNGKNVKRIQLPIVGMVKKGNPAIVIDGTDSYVTSGKIALSGEVVTDKNLSVTFEEPKNLTVDGGTIADLTITEGVAGALNTNKKDARTIIVELPQSSDLEFAEKQNLEVTGLRGLAGTDATVKVTSKIFEDEEGQKDPKKLVLVVDKTGVNTSTGKIKVSNIQVKPEGRDEAAFGDVEVKVTGEAVAETQAVVGKVTEFGVNLSVEEVAEIVAGKTSKEVTVTLQEAVAETLDSRHSAYFALDGGVVKADSLVVKLNDEDVTSKYVEKDVNDETGELQGFEVDFAGIKEDKANTFTFTFKVQGQLANMSDVVLTGESRSFAEDLNVTVAKMTAPVTVDAEAVTVKVGLKGQEGGKITITEAEQGMLKKGELKLTMDDESIKFAKDDLNVETTGTMKVSVKSVEDNEIILNVTRESKEPGTLTISGFAFDVDRTVPEGTEDLVLSGNALSNIDGDALTVEDFVVVGTPNTEDVNGLKKGTGIFTVGANKYTVNGEEKEMDAAPYIAKSNRVMVPVKYVSDVFGINGQDVVFSKENGGTITIFAGNRVLQVVNGSNVALINGIKVPMDEKVAIIDGRTYVPVGEMARLLNVNVEWSNETKTATFTNR